MKSIAAAIKAATHFVCTLFAAGLDAALTTQLPGWAGRLPAAELPWSSLSMKLGRLIVRGAQVAAARQRAGAQEDRMEVASPSPRPWRLLGCEGPLHAGLGFSA